MRKLKLVMEELVVETFDTHDSAIAGTGTVHAHETQQLDGCTIDVPCTRPISCQVELCWEQETNDPYQRKCVTPYVVCSTQGWTCDYCYPIG